MRNKRRYRETLSSPKAAREIRGDANRSCTLAQETSADQEENQCLLPIAQSRPIRHAISAPQMFLFAVEPVVQCQNTCEHRIDPDEYTFLESYEVSKMHMVAHGTI